MTKFGGRLWASVSTGVSSYSRIVESSNDGETWKAHDLTTSGATLFPFGGKLYVPSIFIMSNEIARFTEQDPTFQPKVNDRGEEITLNQVEVFTSEGTRTERRDLRFETLFPGLTEIKPNWFVQIRRSVSVGGNRYFIVADAMTHRGAPAAGFVAYSLDEGNVDVRPLPSRKKNAVPFDLLARDETLYILRNEVVENKFRVSVESWDTAKEHHIERVCFVSNLPAWSFEEQGGSFFFGLSSFRDLEMHDDDVLSRDQGRVFALPKPLLQKPN